MKYKIKYVDKNYFAKVDKNYLQKLVTIYYILLCFVSGNFVLTRFVKKVSGVRNFAKKMQHFAKLSQEKQNPI